MAIITDKAPSKADDELLNKSAAQLQIEIDQRQWALKEKLRIEAEAKRAAEDAEAARRMTSIVNDLKWLHERERLSEKVKASYTTSGGVFAPHLSFKVSRS